MLKVEIDLRIPEKYGFLDFSLKQKCYKAFAPFLRKRRSVQCTVICQHATPVIVAHNIETVSKRSLLSLPVSQLNYELIKGLSCVIEAKRVNLNDIMNILRMMNFHLAIMTHIRPSCYTVI